MRSSSRGKGGEVGGGVVVGKGELSSVYFFREELETELVSLCKAGWDDCMVLQLY